jgi:hypothetical protein
MSHLTWLGVTESYTDGMEQSPFRAATCSSSVQKLFPEVYGIRMFIIVLRVQDPAKRTFGCLTLLLI